MERIETPRLVGEPFQERHLELLVGFLGDQRVVATLGGMRAEPERRERLIRQLAHWDEHGFGDWIFSDRNAGAFVGRAGLRRVVIEGVDEVEVAYALVPERWGQGLATEMAGAALRFGFDEVGLDEIVAFALTDNLASRRVMEKAGFTYERDFEHAGRPHVLYRIRSGSSSDG